MKKNDKMNPDSIKSLKEFNKKPKYKKAKPK